MAEYKVVKIGWENSNDGLNIALVSKKDRTLIGCDIAGGVSVRKDATRIIALVQMQFREFVGQEHVVTLNNKAAQALGVSVGDTVEIDNEVTETEWAAFQSAVPRVHPLEQMMAAMIATRQPRDVQAPTTPEGHE
jgi:hypothetical protein